MTEARYRTSIEFNKEYWNKIEKAREKGYSLPDLVKAGLKTLIDDKIKK